MKKIIDRKIYDTEKAEQLAFYSNGFSRSDFHCVQEVLFRTKKGEYFLHGFGGANSKYAETCGMNCRESGETIIPLTTDEVLSWLEKTNNVETAERLFFDQLSDA